MFGPPSGRKISKISVDAYKTTTTSFGGVQSIKRASPNKTKRRNDYDTPTIFDKGVRRSNSKQAILVSRLAGFHLGVRRMKIIYEIEIWGICASEVRLLKVICILRKCMYLQRKRQIGGWVGNCRAESLKVQKTFRALSDNQNGLLRTTNVLRIQLFGAML
uniref:Uncharacterized protein n=1 Tax=Caenorhabditis japonica TaxID=281687 RepID=A0A8R1E984_CAEJA